MTIPVKDVLISQQKEGWEKGDLLIGITGTTRTNELMIAPSTDNVYGWEPKYLFIWDTSQIIGTNHPEAIAQGVPGISPEFLQQYASTNGKGNIEAEVVLDLSCMKMNDCLKPKLDNNGNIILTIV